MSKPISPEMQRELDSFITYTGRHWRSSLQALWMIAGAPGNLQQLRNSHGPSWLASYKPQKGA